MEKNVIKISISIILIIMVVFAVVFFIQFRKSNEVQLGTKTQDEIDFFGSELLDIANKLNNISFSNYTLVKTKVENTQTQESGSGSGGNLESSQQGKEGQGGNSGNAQNGQNEQSGQEGGSSTGGNGGSSAGGESSGGGQNSSNSKQSEVTEKYEMEPSSILTNKQTEIDWDYIKYNTELLYSNWSTMVIDLHSLNVDNNDILSAGDMLDNLIIATKNEDKVKALQILSDLYSYIPNYTKQCENNSQKTDLAYTKYFLIDTYTLVEENKWDEMQKQMENAKTHFSNIVNSVNEDKANVNKINKVYVLLNELDNCLNYKDKELFYIKYKALMENIESL